MTQATILVFVALPEEHDRLISFFPVKQTFPDSHLVYIEHEIFTEGFRMISVLAAAMGEDNAYDATAAAITKFTPDIIICIGIAGSLTTDLGIGDISVSSEIIDVSQNIKISESVPNRNKRVTQRGRTRRPLQPQTIVELSPKIMPVPPELTASFRFLRSHPTLKVDLAQWVEEATIRRTELLGSSVDSAINGEHSHTPTVEIGPIISGPVVASGAFKDTLRKIARKVVSIETESSGVFRAAAAAKIPVTTIRGISDHADVNKSALERTTKLAARQLAADNAMSYFKIQLKNPSFMRVATLHREVTLEPLLFPQGDAEPGKVLSSVSQSLDAYLERMSPEYKHRPNNAVLPIPRISRQFVDDEIDDIKAKIPKSIYESLVENRRVYVKLPKSFPNQTLAWSIGQALLRSEIDDKQVLPLVVSGEEITPPNKGIKHATGYDPKDAGITRDFTPVIIISEPRYQSEPRMNFLVEELQRYTMCPIIVVSRADTPTDQIDRVKSDLGLVDHVTAPVPFHEIATYLEAAFEMKPAEADSVASRLDETFSKFRLHTHPAYFVGLQETTIDALIQANHRAELIQLAVDGLLSFVVAFDESPVKLSRTTREEFLGDLALQLRVERRAFAKVDLYTYVQEFGRRKALEIQPDEFLKGYFSVGLLSEFDGYISFSLPYLEAYLLSERLRGDAVAATRYFDPYQADFDQFAFDLYVERGACDDVVNAVCLFAKSALAKCDQSENVYIGKAIKPRALSTPQMLLKLAHQMGETAARMTDGTGDNELRHQKQRLLDTKEAVRGRVASRDPLVQDDYPIETLQEFRRLDELSQATTLLATVIGSGAERLDGAIKERVANLVLSVFERFIHFWTLNRLNVDFDELREELKSDEVVDAIIKGSGLYEESKQEVRDNLLLFLDDQELRLLSGPAITLLDRLSQYAGVRSLRPVFARMKPRNLMERLIRDVWLMDVEHNDGKRFLKEALQEYKGSPLMRLVITSHLMNRIFWHHWQRESRAVFVNVARYSLAPIGLKPGEEHTRTMLGGSKK